MVLSRLNPRDYAIERQADNRKSQNAGVARGRIHPIHGDLQIPSIRRLLSTDEEAHFASRVGRFCLDRGDNLRDI